MELNQPSHTAHLVAMSRAAHQILDNPRVFEDPIAARIIGKQKSAEIASAPDQYKTTSATLVRAFLVARSKYVETALSEAIEREVHQYVILGAGLDTFPYRNPYHSELLQVFEVDHPSTQAWKRERIETEGISIPESLRFVSIDFEKETLENQLPKAGFKINEPSFFSWIGVTMYLTTEVVMATLKSIGMVATRGSEIVFDYMLSPALLSPTGLLSFHARAARVSAVGEPWKSTFEPNLLAAELHKLGFAIVEDIGSDGLNARYFANRTDELRVDGRARLIKVIINQNQRNDL